MIVVWLKFAHVAGIALWSAGLVSLPFLFVQRTGLEKSRLFRLHVFTRSLYVFLISPAAFVAVGTGTALIILQGTYENWFSAKLVGVAAMTGIHIFSGLVILRLFEPEQSYPHWRVATSVTVSLLVISAILVLVLGKPDIEWPEALDSFFAPGALSELFYSITGGTR